MINKIQVEIVIDNSGKVLDVQSNGISIIKQFFTVEDDMDWKAEVTKLFPVENDD